MNEETQLIDPAQDFNAPVAEENQKQENRSNKAQRVATILAGVAAVSAVGAGAAVGANYLVDENPEPEPEPEVTEEPAAEATVHQETVVHHVYDRAPQQADGDKIPEDAEISGGYVGPDDPTPGPTPGPTPPPTPPEDFPFKVLDAEETEIEGQPCQIFVVEHKETGAQAILIDVGPTGTLDYMIADFDGDGDITPEEMIDISDQKTSTKPFIEAYNNTHKDAEFIDDDAHIDDTIGDVSLEDEDEDDGEVDVVAATEDHDPNDIATPVSVEDSDLADEPVAIESEVEVEPEVIDEPMAYEEPATETYEEPEVYREEPAYEPVQTEDYASADPMPDYDPNADTGFLEA